MQKQWSDVYWKAFFKDAYSKGDARAVENGFRCIECYEGQFERLTLWWREYLREQEGE
ncbi:hypothetical protein Atoyac13_33 [Aeromonas phage Atoyac13]|nr:hypothetical protein Atoyac10_33 [Aeromonas phage Atoyac10]QOC54305.1 hypothetical protein Atoyac13_33 [Aeromonas phage Atoyac13]